MNKIDPRVLLAVQTELAYQDRKFGPEKEQSFPGYVLIMQNELNEAIDAWTKGPWEGRDSALAEITQVVAVGMRCLQTYGTHGCPAATNDSLPSDT